jgi:ATPase family associated with various cellular activities (AAA)
MSSHFVLTLAARQGAHFNVRRDVNGIVGLAGRHLVWSASALTRLREFLIRRCFGNELWRDHEALDPAQFLAHHGTWRGPYDEATLFFFLDEYAKDQLKDLISVLAVTGEWLSHSLKKQSTLVEKNINALASLLQLNKAERALFLYGALARYQRDMRSILIELKVNNAPEAFAAIAEVAGVNPQEVGDALREGSRLERIGLVENLISENNITDLSDLMKVSDKLPPVLMRQYRDQAELMVVFTRLSSKNALVMDDFRFVAEDAKLLCRLLANAVARKGAEDFILLLDEADSFLQDRLSAQRNYEVTEVNEMLQGMERFRGIFICTTNLIDGPGRPSGVAPVYLQNPVQTPHPLPMRNSFCDRSL